MVKIAMHYCLKYLSTGSCSQKTRAPFSFLTIDIRLSLKGTIVTNAIDLKSHNLMNKRRNSRPLLLRISEVF